MRVAFVLAITLSKASLKTFGPDRIRLCWVPGHNRILGKETTDALTRLCSLFICDLIVGPGLTICHLYGLINGWVRGEA